MTEPARSSAPTTRNPRWYVPTLDRVLLALLLLEGLLYLSDRFDWFAFNRLKGWTVLITVVTVASVLLLVAIWTLISWIISRWTRRAPYQFGLRSVLLLVPVIAVACGWLASSMRQAQKAKFASHALARSGGDVQLGRSQPWEPLHPVPPPKRLLELLGDEFFAPITIVSVKKDSDLPWLTDLSEVEGLLLDGSLLGNAGANPRLFPQTGTTISDEGLATIRGLTHVESVSVCSEKMTNASLASLSRLPSLKGLSLARTQVDDDGLRHLAGRSNLVQLAINSDKDLELLLWPRVAPLKFDDPVLERAKLRTRMHKVRAATDWAMLGVDSPDIASWGLKSSRPQRVTDAGLVHLKNHRQLTTLAICGSPIAGTGFQHLQQCDALNVLLLLDCPVTDAGLEQIAGLRRLRTLMLSGERISDEGITHLASMQELASLWLDTSPIDGSGLSHVAKLPSLKVLTLSRTKINDAGLAGIRDAKGLTYLNLRGADVTDEGLAHLAELTELTELDLSGTCVTGAGLIHLAKLTKLNKLNFSETPLTSDSLALLSKFPSLLELDISFTSADDRVMPHLVPLKTLRTIKLSGTLVTDEGLAILKSAPLLQNLDLANTEITDAGLKHLSAVPRLFWLDVTETKVTGAGIGSLQKVFPRLNVEQ